jgi:hypothetical protein
MAMNAEFAESDAGAAPETAPTKPVDKDKALPLPGWLVKVYFIFPIILYIPDAIFNYFVYSDGAYVPNAPLAVQISQVALWGFLSIGVVGMAYLLSVLAPWHWSNGHRLQALFCWVGVLIATMITIWNSLSYRSVTFNEFATDKWLYNYFPQLAAQANHGKGISLTMILVAIAPPFWGLFWALVQPTNHRKSLSALAENHAEKLMRVQHEAQLKAMRAEANAKVREAQLKGMAQTAAAARAQAGTLFSRKDGDKATTGEQPAVSATATAKAEPAPVTTPASDEGQGGNILQMPRFVATRPRGDGDVRKASMLNEAAPVTRSHAEPSRGAIAAQAPLMSEAGLRAPTTGTKSSRQPTAAYTPDVMEFDGGMTGTTGPRPAVRRVAEPSPLLRAMNEPSPVYVQAVNDALKELSGNGKRVTQKEWIARVAEKLNVDESSAKAIFNRVRELQKTARP